jgi:hypothetical protein
MTIDKIVEIFAMIARVVVGAARGPGSYPGSHIVAAAGITTVHGSQWYAILAGWLLLDIVGCGVGVCVARHC